MLPRPENPRQTKRGGKKLAPLLLVFSLLALFLLLPLFKGLTVEDRRSGDTLLVLPIARGEIFKLRFTHSVNLSYVTDTNQWTGEELILRSTLFTSFGAGMPVLADGIGTGFANTEEGFLITGIDTAQKDNTIPIMLQTVPDHHLLYRGGEISLRALAGGNGYIALRVRPVSLLEMLLYGNTNPS